MDEYAAVVRKFYEVYRPIGRRYNLRVHSRFSMNRPGFIKIYQGDGPDRKQIIKVKEDDDIACYKRAIDELESWAKSRKREIQDSVRRSEYAIPCGEYFVTNEHAERLRRKLKLITGGHTS